MVENRRCCVRGIGDAWNLRKRRAILPRLWHLTNDSSAERIDTATLMTRLLVHTYELVRRPLGLGNSPETVFYAHSAWLECDNPTG